MSSDHHFSSTVPASLEEGFMPEEGQVAHDLRAEVQRAEYDVVGIAGTELAQPLGVLRKSVDAAVRSGQLSATQALPMVAAIDAASRIAMQARLLAKLASGSVRHSNEQIALDPILNQLLDLRRQSFAQERIAVQRDVRPVTVVVDRDLATALLDAAVEWSIAPGHALEVTLEVKHWPAHGLLRLRRRRMPSADAAALSAQDDGQEKLSWFLLTELGRAVGATLDRIRSPGETVLMLEFPRTVRELEGLTAMEVELGLPMSGADASKALAGHRALIITSDVKLREEAKRVCQSMGLQVDNVPSSSLAAQRCAEDSPHVILVDERFNDEPFQALRQQLLQTQPNFPMVEIAYGRDTDPAVVGWGSGQMTRVTRSQLALQLPQALTLELSKLL